MGVIVLSAAGADPNPKCIIVYALHTTYGGSIWGTMKEAGLSRQQTDAEEEFAFFQSNAHACYGRAAIANLPCQSQARHVQQSVIFYPRGR